MVARWRAPAERQQRERHEVSAACIKLSAKRNPGFAARGFVLTSNQVWKAVGAASKRGGT